MADIRTLTRLRDQYQAKADRYYESYQMDGQTSALRAYERNEAMADALTDAMAAQDTKETCRWRSSASRSAWARGGCDGRGA